MAEFKDLFQSADWKVEKHAPVIIAPDTVKAGEFFQVTVNIGEEIAHPNKTEHHIRWINVYFKAEDDSAPYEIGKFDFNAHGESAKGPDTSSVYTHPECAFRFRTGRSGTIHASSYCNIHGLWQSSRYITVA
ncbi:class II SORL domain-containing protein [bacterium]|nr:class II SORL domain-containing protein [candidate division CSSED10-310 bacterium]